MALRPTPKRKVDYEKLDDLQKQIFGSETEESESPATAKSASENSKKSTAGDKERDEKTSAESKRTEEAVSQPDLKRKKQDDVPKAISAQDSSQISASADSFGEHLSDMETIAARIASSKAGQGRNTTRPFSLPRTLIIDTTRLKAKFRTIDEQFTQNVIVDFLLREALAAVSPENYKDLRASAFEFIKRPEETTRRSLTITEEVVYQMSELKAGINLETGKKYSNDEIFSTLLALGVSWLYRNGILS